jgi:hypothetical protein
MGEGRGEGDVSRLLDLGALAVTSCFLTLASPRDGEEALLGTLFSVARHERGFNANH